MSDFIDQSLKQSAVLLECSIENARMHAKERERIPTGLCHNCEEKLPKPKIFCDEDCRIDWERRHKNDIHH